MKKSLFSVLCALCAISYAGISPNAWAQSNDADEILPPIVFLVLDTSASMNLFFDKDANQTRLTNAMAEIIGGMKLTTDGKLIRAQGGKLREVRKLSEPQVVLAHYAEAPDYRVERSKHGVAHIA